MGKFHHIFLTFSVKTKDNGDNMPDNIKFSYKLYTSCKDTMHSKIDTIDLPENVTAEVFTRLVKRNIPIGSSGKIELTKKIANMAGIPVTKHITLYFDKKIKSQGDIHTMLVEQFKTGNDVFSYTPSNIQKFPAVITGTIIHKKAGHSFDYSREQTWNEHQPVVESLNAENDVLVNYDLNEIWPESTGVIPKIVKDFFENER